MFSGIGSKAQMSVNINEKSDIVADPADILQCFLSQNECWVYYFGPDTKRQSMHWKYPSSPAQKKANVISPPEKVMASVVWEAKGIVLIDYNTKMRHHQCQLAKSVTKGYENQTPLKTDESGFASSRPMLRHTF